MPKIEIKQADSTEKRQELYDFASKFLDLGEKTQDLYLKPVTSLTYSEEFVSETQATLTGSILSHSLDEEGFDFTQEFKLNTWLEILKLSEISFSSKFIIANSNRKNRTVLSLMKKNYQSLLAQGTRLDFICCPDPSRSFYEWLGYRKLSNAFHVPSSPWPLVPMALVLGDFDYLDRINSPLLHGASQSIKDEYKYDEKLALFIEKHFLDEYIRPTAYILLRKLASRYNLFFKNELLQPYISVLKHNHYLNGETVYKKDSRGSSLHLIIRGSVTIGKKNFNVGDFFGAACLLRPGLREATVIAEDDLETLELDSNDFYSILENKPQTAPVILNLIGEKLRELNTRLLAN